MEINQYNTANPIITQLNDINTELLFISSSECRRYPLTQLSYRTFDYDYKYGTDLLTLIISKLEEEKSTLETQLNLI